MPVEPYAALPWQEYEQLLADQLKLRKLEDKFQELERSKLHNRDNLLRFFKGLV